MIIIKNKKNIIFALFLTIFIVKIIIMGLFSSEYQDKLFYPFINHFVSNGGDPWNWVYINKLHYEFPYHPLMLYFFSIGTVLIKFLHVDNIFIHNVLFKLPTLFADVAIYILLLKTFKNKPINILIFYFLSPIILYASYMHSQLDLLPVAFLFWSVYFLKKNKYYKASLALGMATCIKMNILLLLPILIIYICKTTKKRKALLSFLIIAGIYLLFSIPYLFSAGYHHLVLLNEKQNLLFNFNLALGNIKIYISLFIAALIYLRFLAYQKINNELLDLYIVLAISLFLIFVPPSTPAWFIWLVPFLNLFVIKYEKIDKNVIRSYWLLNFIYVVYFVFFHIGDYEDLSFLSNSISLKFTNEFLRNCVFTILEAALVCIIYCVYKIGIQSNSIYKKENALVIGIGGDSGSGKSTLLFDIQHLLKENLIILEGDGDHKWERGDKHWEKMTHLNPKANFLHKQISDILKLKKMQLVYRSDYNHQTGKFDKPIKIEPKQFVVLSGLHPFYLPKMRKIIDIKIYLNPDETLRKYWKICRDTKNRGYSIAQVINSMKKRANDVNKYIRPQINFADIVITYFPMNKVDLSNSTEKEVNLGIKLKLESSIFMDDILTILSDEGIDINWDYSNDLKSQEIIISSNLEQFDWEQITKDTITNVEEIVSPDCIFENGQRGFIQFLTLRVLSEKMKEAHDKRYFN